MSDHRRRRALGGDASRKRALLTSFDDLFVLAADIDRARRTGTECRVDLRGSSSDSGRGYDPDAVVAASSLLLTSVAADTAVHVAMPQRKSDLLQLAECGLLFALAQRAEDRVTIDWGDSDEDFLDLGATTRHQLSQWRADWHPSNLWYRTLLLDPQPPEPLPANPVSVVQGSFVSFLNPHRTSRSRVNAELTHNLAVPWVARILEDHHGVSDQPLLIDVAAVLDEAILNLVDYAFSTAFEGDSRSFVNLYLREGKRDGSGTLTILICDFGVGIPSTLRAKLIRDHDTLDIDLIERALTGQLAYNHNRGRGLPGIADIAGSHHADLTIMTRTDAGFVRTSGTGRDYRPDEYLVPYAGTAVRMAIPVRRPVPAEPQPQPQAELEFQG